MATSTYANRADFARGSVEVSHSYLKSDLVKRGEKLIALYPMAIINPGNLEGEVETASTSRKTEALSDPSGAPHEFSLGKTDSAAIG